MGRHNTLHIWDSCHHPRAQNIAASYGDFLREESALQGLGTAQWLVLPANTPADTAVGWDNLWLGFERQGARELLEAFYPAVHHCVCYYCWVAANETALWRDCYLM
jgi:hypothetical protein